MGLPNDQQTAVGHWADNSSMPVSYDSNGNSLETQAKAKVQMAVRDGWNLRPEGSFPMEIPKAIPSTPLPGHKCCTPEDRVFYQADSPEMPVTPSLPVPVNDRLGWDEGSPFGNLPIDTACKRCQQLSSFEWFPYAETHTCTLKEGSDSEDESVQAIVGTASPARLATRTMYENPVQVVDRRTGVIHLYTEGAYTVCSTFQCDTPGKPRAIAEFHRSATVLQMEEHSLFLCKRCYHAGASDKFGHAENIRPYYDLVLSDESDSDEESGADSSDSSISSI
jgi:hypothetical protein